MAVLFAWNQRPKDKISYESLRLAAELPDTELRRTLWVSLYLYIVLCIIMSPVHHRETFCFRGIHLSVPLPLRRKQLHLLEQFFLFSSNMMAAPQFYKTILCHSITGKPFQFFKPNLYFSLRILFQ